MASVPSIWFKTWMWRLNHWKTMGSYCRTLCIPVIVFKLKWSGALQFFFLIRFSDNLDAYSIRAGSTYHRNGGLVIKIKRIVLNECYNSSSINFDFSLLELDESLTFSDQIQSIALANEDTIVEDGTLSLVTGWGEQSLFYQLIEMSIKYCVFFFK